MSVDVTSTALCSARLDAEVAIENLILRMTAIITDANGMIITGDPVHLDMLRPLRLSMASAVTSFQFALNERSAIMDMQDDHRKDDFRCAITDWSMLSREFRAFTFHNQSSNPLNWDEYVPAATEFMKKFIFRMRNMTDMLTSST